MGLCGFSPKISAVIAGFLTLLQGLLWSILAIIVLLVYSCSISVTEDLSSPQFYRFYLVYLYTGGKCGNVEIETETENGTVSVAWPEDESRAAGRTHAWIIVYLSFSLAWVIAALLLVIASVSEIKGVKGLFLRAPWLVLTSSFVILDLVTSIIYAIDISYTSNLEQLLTFVGVDFDSNTINSSATSSTFGYLTMAPSILALVIFSRLVLGWALNLILLIHIAQDAKNNEKPPPPALPEPRQPYQQYLKKLSTIGPVPDVKWDPHQRRRSDLPILKPLEIPSPPNERKRKMSDYQQYMFYAKKSSQLNYLDDIRSEPPTPAVGSEPTTGVLQSSTSQAQSRDDLNLSKGRDTLPVPVPAPDY